MAWRRRLPVVADLDAGRVNNFNLLRMIAATAVLVSHAWPLALGTGTAEPLQDITGYKLGSTAVTIFFAVSGFFITKSFDRRASLIDFTVARVARIYPALIVVLVLSVAVLGPLATTLPIGTYATEWHSWTYLPHNLLLRHPQWALPGVFAANPGGWAINGSLWTLAHEVTCYVAVVLGGLVGLTRRATLPLVLGVCATLTALVLQDEQGGYAGLMSAMYLPFALGAAAYVYRAHLPLSGWAVLALAGAAAAVGVASPAYPLLHALALSYGALWFGFALPWLRGYARLGDYSYGMYIYAFPVQQVAVWLMPGSTPGALIAWSLPVTLVLAIVSWRLIEAPALARRHWLRPRTWAARREVAEAS